MTISPTVVVWPAVVLVCFVIFLAVFHRPLYGLISRIDKAKLRGTEISFGQVPTDRESPHHFEVENREPLPQTARWANTGNLYWLGHDMMWTMQMMLRGAPREKIAHGVNQSYYHITHLGLTGSLPARQLLGFKGRLNGLQDSQLDREWRTRAAGELQRIIDEAGLLASENQRDFERDVRHH